MTTSYFDLDKRRRDEMIRATLDKIELSPFAKTELPPFYRSGRAPKVPKVPRVSLIPEPIDVGFKPAGGPICFRCFRDFGTHHELVVILKTTLEVALTFDGVDWVDSGMIHDKLEVTLRCPSCHCYNHETGWGVESKEGGAINGMYELVRVSGW